MSCCSSFLDHPLAVGLDGGLMGFFYFLIVLEAFWVGSSFVTFLSRVVPHVMLGYTNVGLKVRLLATMSKSLGMKITSSTCLTTRYDILQQQGAQISANGIACESRSLWASLESCSTFGQQEQEVV
ncbi:hypothetical protein YC2023_013983 [Brassica napus]|uniref:(rape) hypothetical protein n=1 Tax=Brassica napus TaxID=3708 RepID=A0A816JUR3_BRANA|nr:unnamed protein product [Brassica napus]